MWLTACPEEYLNGIVLNGLVKNICFSFCDTVNCYIGSLGSFKDLFISGTLSRHIQPQTMPTHTLSNTILLLWGYPAHSSCSLSSFITLTTSQHLLIPPIPRHPFTTICVTAGITHHCYHQSTIITIIHHYLYHFCQHLYCPNIPAPPPIPASFSS